MPRHQPLVRHVELSGARRDPQFHVEHQQADQAQHEHRHRLPGQAHHAHHMVESRALPRRGEHAQRHTDDDGDDDRRRSQLQCGRKELCDVGGDRMRRHDRSAEVAVQQVHQVDPELHEQRLVEAKLLAHRGDHVGRRVVAGDCDHRIDRHHPADQERDLDQAEQRNWDAGKISRQHLQPGGHALVICAYLV
jgi:hypothetical protein